MKVDGYRPPWSNYFVIRIMLALAWFAVSLGALGDKAGPSGFAILLGLATAAPVLLAALLYRFVGPRLSFVTDTTGILYAIFMVHLFLSVDISVDGLNAVVFLVYPVLAIVTLMAEALVLGMWRSSRTRSADGPSDTS